MNETKDQLKALEEVLKQKESAMESAEQEKALLTENKRK